MLGLRVVPNLNRNSIYGGTRPTEAPGRIAPVGVVATDRQKLHSPHWKPRIGYLDRLPQKIEYIGLRRILRPSGKVVREGGALRMALSIWP